MATANDPAAATPEAGVDAELEAVLDALFRGPRERFVAARNAAAQRLRARGRTEAAARLRALAKPGISAWAVNQLWWTARGQMEALLDAGRRSAEAMRTGTGPAAQAAAGQARRRALETLMAAAGEILAQAGHASSAGTLRRIGTTLEALAAHAALGQRPPLGRLTEDLDPPGFELVVGLGANVPPGMGISTSPEPGTGDAGDTEAAVAAAERERDEASEQVDRAARALDEATHAADEAVLEAQRTAQEHRQARARAEAARQLAEEAERTALRAQAEARRQQERVDAAREALTRRAAELERRSEALVARRRSRPRPA